VLNTYKITRVMKLDGSKKITKKMVQPDIDIPSQPRELQIADPAPSETDGVLRPCYGLS
jgi:hypothetical protein